MRTGKCNMGIRCFFSVREEINIEKMPGNLSGINTNLFQLFLYPGYTKALNKNSLMCLKCNFYFWILHPVACIIMIVGNTVPAEIVAGTVSPTI
jgi:hypothetical protein